MIAPDGRFASQEARYGNGVTLLTDSARAVSGYPDMRPFRGSTGWNQRTTQ